MEILIVTAIVLWCALGCLGWYLQIRRCGFTSAFDGIMIGPCMLLGPIALYVLIRDPTVS